MKTMMTTDGVLRLARRETMDLGPRGGQAITCVQGCLWITVDNDSRDIVLEPGQTHRSEAGERVLVFALQASVATVKTLQVVQAGWPEGEAVAA